MAKKVKIKTKKEIPAKDMVKYTARDFGQEYIMKRKMVRAIVLAILSLIALAVFVALYIAETAKVKEKFRQQYRKSLDTFSLDLDNYLNADGDFEFRYRVLLSDISNVNAFVFLVDDYEDKQKSINGLYTVFIKYPEQTQKRLDEVAVFIKDVIANLDKGYEEMDKFVESIDKKGY